MTRKREKKMERTRRKTDKGLTNSIKLEGWKVKKRTHMKEMNRLIKIISEELSLLRTRKSRRTNHSGLFMTS
jgi:hypothetical protein